MLNFTSLLKLLDNLQNIVITTHSNPDGDAIGSSLALYAFLASRDKTVNIITFDSCPEIYKFLHFSKHVQRYCGKHDPTIYEAEAIVLLDCNSFLRVGLPLDTMLQPDAKKILIDHHMNSEDFPGIVYSAPSVSATAELIYELLIQAKARITKDIAEALFTAIYTDSGGFRYPSTSSNTLFIASELVKHGAVPAYIYDNVYNSNSLNKLRFYGAVWQELKPYFSSQLIIVCISGHMLKQYEVKREELEGISTMPLTISGSKAVVVITQYNSSETRVSLRSKGDIDVQSIAQKYGGGGHKNAAGCKFNNMELNKIQSTFIKEFSALFK